MNDDIMRHKKKKDQKSKSNKCSNHKHQYEKIIVKTIAGWNWAMQCVICGRIKEKFSLACKDFIRPECRHLPYIGDSVCYSYAELIKLYPNVKIIK